MKRTYKDCDKSASPKQQLVATFSSAAWRLDFRIPERSLAEAPRLLAGELILIPNTQPSAASQNFGQIRQFKVALAILTRLKMGWREKYRLRLAYTYRSKEVDTQRRSRTSFCPTPNPLRNCESPSENSIAAFREDTIFGFEVSND